MVFKTDDGQFYMRTGEKSEISNEASLTQELYGRGFPVSEVTAVGELKDGSVYFIERSIGKHTLGQVFEQDTKETGHVREENFQKFINVMEKFLDAQSRPENLQPQNLESLDHIVALERLMKYNPPSTDKLELYNEAYRRIGQRLSELPWGFLQTDLNPKNMLEHGVIDFERTIVGPVGYDVMIALLTKKIPYKWPNWDEWEFTPEQMRDYIQQMDAVSTKYGLPPISEYVNEFLLLRIMQMSHFGPKKDDILVQTPITEHMTSLRDWCIEQYVQTGHIEPDKFEDSK